VIAELRNQILSLKNQQRDHLEQVKHERKSSLLLLLLSFGLLDAEKLNFI